MTKSPGGQVRSTHVTHMLLRFSIIAAMLGRLAHGVGGTWHRRRTNGMARPTSFVVTCTLSHAPSSQDASLIHFIQSHMIRIHLLVRLHGDCP